MAWHFAGSKETGGPRYESVYGFKETHFATDHERLSSEYMYFFPRWNLFKVAVWMIIWRLFLGTI